MGIAMKRDFGAPMRFGLLVLGAFGCATVETVRAADWPGWRGPTGMGQASDRGLPIAWDGSQGANVLWKSPLLDGREMLRLDQNQSSPIVHGDRAYVTLSYWRQGVAPDKAPPEHHVVCFRTSDGQRLWDTRVAAGPWLLKDLRGGYTAPTPAADSERVYVLFGSSVAAALDVRGQLVWRKDVRPFAFDVAIGTSPVLYRDTLLLACDQTDRTSRLIALDKKTGELRWEKKRPMADWAHSTPVLADVKGRAQLLVGSAFAVQGLDPDNGDTLWSCGSGDRTPARVGDTVSPVLAGGVVYCDSGRGGPGVAVDPTGAGDVTATHRKWKVARVPEGFGSPVASGDYLYRLHSPGVVTCRRLSDGETVFQERLAGVAVAPSPFATPERRVYFASAGKSYVIKAGPKFEVLGTSDLGDASQASPAVSGGRIFLRGARYLYCVGNK
jgi:outer membrane protein assembly factor BamB